MLLLLAIAPVRVLAAGDDLWGLDELRNALPEEAEEYLGTEEPGQVDGAAAERVGARFLDRLREAKREEAAFFLLLLSVTVASSAAESVRESGSGPDSALLASAAAVFTAAASDMNSYTEISRAALQSLADYADVLLPTLAAAGSVTGTLTSAAGKCASTALFMNILIHLAQTVIFPLICGFAALSAADAVVGNRSLSSAAALLRSACTALLGTLSLGFTFWLSAVSLVAGSGEAAAAKLTKSVLSTSLPVAGKVLSDASGALSAAAVSIRGSAGVFGLAAVLCICLTPCLRLGLRLAVYKLAAAVCRCLCDSRLSGLLDSLGEVFALLLGLVGTAALALFMAVFSLIRAVS